MTGSKNNMSIIREIPKLNPVLENLLKHAHRKTFDARQINVQAENEAGDEIILAHLNEGDFFGEAGLFDFLNTDESKRTAWVITRSKSVIAEISYKQFRKIVSDDPAVMFLLTSQIFNRLRKTSHKVRDLVFLDVKGRIAHCLIELTEEPDAMTPPDGMQIKITRQDIAKMVGCSREMAGRVLKELDDEDLISAHGKTIVVFGAR